MPACSRQEDQAAGLRRIAQHAPVRVVAVTSGKGGVGKTNVSVNLAMSLASSGQNVMILDADLGLANVDVLLGLNPRQNLSHVVRGECELGEIILDAASGVRVIPASSGVQDMVALGPLQHAGIVRAFSGLNVNLDVLLVDTAAGISENVVSFARAAQEVIVVVCDEPASITDAYAMIKLLNRDHGVYRFRILANMAHSLCEGVELYNKLVKVTDRFLDATLDYMGAVPYDDYVRKAVQKQRAVCDAYPRSKASTAFRKLATKIGEWPMPSTASGNLEFFVERLIEASKGLPTDATVKQ